MNQIYNIIFYAVIVHYIVYVGLLNFFFLCKCRKKIDLIHLAPGCLLIIFVRGEERSGRGDK